MKFQLTIACLLALAGGSGCSKMASQPSAASPECLSNMQDMVSRYGKQVMICEVGMEADQPTITESFLKDIIAKTKSVSGGLPAGK